MCARFKFTVPEQFTKGNLNLFNKGPAQLEARPGTLVPFVTPKGTEYMGLWTGFARIETLKTVWIAKGWKPVRIINGVSFQERDTTGGTKELKEFPMKQGTGIGAVAKVVKGNYKDYVEVKVVTQPADENVKKVHHRMPKILE